MASGPAQHSTTPDVVPGEHRYEKLPNARPTGQELVPDQAWTTWRLRNQRPELVADMPKTFPDISKHRHEEANQLVEASIAEANAERAKEPRFRERSFEQLRDYRPVQLTFRPLHESYDEANRQLARRHRQAHLDDSDDDDDKIPGFWIDRLSFDLFTRVWQFASNTFGHECFGSRLYDQDWTRCWLTKLPKEFVKYASEVARGDPVIMPPPQTDPNNWEYLFLAKDSRVLLIVGIIAKILEDNVFGSLLFGATPGQKQALHNIDNETATLADSYARNYPRSGIAKQFVLAGRTPTGYLPDLYTDNFWDEVDSVTMSILCLLLPLINMLGELSPEAGWPALTKVHQELHDIVAEAGWFTNGMRVSKSIFWVQFPEPGDLWDIHQEHVMESIWKNSKAAAARLDEAEAARWEADMVAKWRAENAGETVDLEWRQVYEQNHPTPSEPRRTAKAQIVLWPWIDQYSPVQPKSDGNLNLGETITHIVKAQIVYYAGDESSEGEARERLTLEEHIRQARVWKLGGWSFWGFLALLFCSIISLRLYGTYQTPYLREAGSRLRRAWQPTTESLRVSPTIVVSVDVDLVLPPATSSDSYVAAETALSAATSGDQTTPWVTESSQTAGSYTTTSSSTESAKVELDERNGDSDSLDGGLAKSGSSSFAGSSSAISSSVSSSSTRSSSARSSSASASSAIASSTRSSSTRSSSSRSSRPTTQVSPSTSTSTEIATVEVVARGGDPANHDGRPDEPGNTDKPIEGPVRLGSSSSADASKTSGSLKSTASSVSPPSSSFSQDGVWESIIFGYMGFKRSTHPSTTSVASTSSAGALNEESANGMHRTASPSYPTTRSVETEPTGLLRPPSSSRTSSSAFDDLHRTASPSFPSRSSNSHKPTSSSRPASSSRWTSTPRRWF